jgi:DNA-binding CsgD family transcriptional regulator
MSKSAPQKRVRAQSEVRAASRASAGPISPRLLSCEVLLARFFALTPAEARLARCLLKGDTLEEAASALNIKLQTARNHHLRSVFRKTGTARQTQLVTLLVRVVHLEDGKPAIWATN